MAALELKSVRDSEVFGLEILKANDNTALLQCTSDTAHSLIKRLGGSYKIARVYGSSPEELLEQLFLPDTDRFNWTLSGYDSLPDTIDQLKLEFLHFLKSKSIRKAKFLEPSISVKGSSSTQSISREEMKVNELHSRILKPPHGTSPGFDLIVESSLGGKPIYACTEASSDVVGFERRDFGRSYQDPTITMSPRIARIIVNLSVKSETRTILDPFCGLGTILQEALVCGFNVVGVDKNPVNVQKARSNIDWLKKEFQLSPKVRSRVIQYDARKLSGVVLPEIDAISTEPILLPKFERNPDASVSQDALVKAMTTYETSIQVMSQLVKNSRGRVALVTPTIIDNRGGAHQLSIVPVIDRMKMKLYCPSVHGLRFEYPMKIDAEKKRIINRNVCVFEPA